MGNPKHRRLGRVTACATGLVLFTTAFPAVAENLYKFTRGGTDFYGYTDALIALDISNGMVTGQLRPLLGDRTAPVNVHGTNPQDGVLNLTIDLRAGPKTYTFTKKVIGQKIVWQDPHESSLSIYRYVDSPLTDAAQTLGEYECGASYRSMVAELLPQTTKDRLNAFLSTDPQASSLAVTYNAYDKKKDLWTKRTTVRLGEFLKLQLGVSEQDRSMRIQFETAVGTEAYLAKWMRGSSLFKFADLDPGGCDGMDRSYFVIDRGLLFDADGLSQEKFGRYIETRLRDFSSQDDKGKAWQFRLGQSRMTRVNLPITPAPVAYRVRVYAASEVTRRVPGWWDTFWVTFEAGDLMDIKTTEYPIVVTVDRLKSSKRSSGNSSPPDDAYFTKELELTDEAEVTAAIAQYFARRDHGWCLVQMAGDEADKHRAVCEGMAAR